MLNNLNTFISEFGLKILSVIGQTTVTDWIQVFLTFGLVLFAYTSWNEANKLRKLQHYQFVSNNMPQIDVRLNSDSMNFGGRFFNISFMFLNSGATVNNFSLNLILITSKTYDNNIDNEYGFEKIHYYSDKLKKNVVEEIEFKTRNKISDLLQGLFSESFSGYATFIARTEYSIPSYLTEEGSERIEESIDIFSYDHWINRFKKCDHFDKLKLLKKYNHETPEYLKELYKIKTN